MMYWCRVLGAEEHRGLVLPAVNDLVHESFHSGTWKGGKEMEAGRGRARPLIWNSMLLLQCPISPGINLLVHLRRPQPATRASLDGVCLGSQIFRLQCSSLLLCLGRAGEDDSGVWLLYSPMGDPDKSASSWLQPSQPPASSSRLEWTRIFSLPPILALQLSFSNK